MSLYNSSNEYGSINKGIHWIMAFLVFIQFTIAWTFINLPEEAPLKNTLFQYHVLNGITIFMLVLLRIYWRVSKPKVLPAAINSIELWTAQSVHFFFYVAMIAMPLSGYIMVTAKEGDVINLFGLSIPPLFVSKYTAEMAYLCHVYLSYVLFGAIILHIIGALIHKNKMVLNRML